MICDVAERIDQLHDSGFAHRDLKPGNIMLLPHRLTWVLIDFGISARIGEQAPLQFTHNYAAPETAAAFCQGQSTMMSSAEVDAWALGVIGYEVLVGKHPFLLTPKDDVRLLRTAVLFGKEDIFAKV